MCPLGIARRQIRIPHARSPVFEAGFHIHLFTSKVPSGRVLYAGVSFGGVISAGSRSGLGRRNRKVWRKDRPDQAVKSETSNAKAAGTDIRRRYGPNASSARSSGGVGPSKASTGRLPSR